MGYKPIFVTLLKSSTVTTWLSFLTKALSFIVVLPLILNRYSPPDISLWHLFLTVWSFQMVFDAGFGSAFVRIIAYGSVGVKNFSFSVVEEKEEMISETTQDIPFLKSTLQVMKSFYLVLAIVCFFILITFGTYFFEKPILEASFVSLGWKNWYFFVLTYPLLIWGNIYVNFLIGNHFIPQLRIGETVFNLLSIITVSVLGYLQCNIHWLIFSYQCWFVLGVFRNILICKIFLGHIRLSTVRESSTKQVKELVLSNALKSGIGVAMAQGVTQGTSLLYAQVTSPALLASYLVGLNIANSIKSFAQAPFYSKLPLLATLMGKGQKAKLAEVSALNMRRVYVIFLFFFLLTTVTHQYVFELIGSKVAFPDLKIWFLIGFGILIERFGAMHLQVYSTSNHIIWHWLNGITGLILLVFFIVTLPKIGLYAFPAGYAFAYLCFYSWYAPKISYELLKTTFWKFERFSFLPMLIIFFLFSVLILNIY
ncbi:MAG: hypothetical protein ACJA2N_001716 [Salibacteraceae bacterium]|jgi:hypothetical protein